MRTKVFEQVRLSPKALFDLLAAVPATRESPCSAPQLRAHAIARSACLKAASASGAISLPAGPLGWLTIPLELASVLRIQAQMVADIAGAYGCSSVLSRALLMQCLFERAVPQVTRDLLLRLGQPLLARVVCRIGIGLGRCAPARGVARALPLVGAVLSAYCARSDTHRVAVVAIALFEQPAGASPHEWPSGLRPDVSLGDATPA